MQAWAATASNVLSCKMNFSLACNAVKNSGILVIYSSSFDSGISIKNLGARVADERRNPVLQQKGILLVSVSWW